MQAGDRIDPALEQVYSFDTGGLDALWRASLGFFTTESGPENELVASTPTQVPTLAPLNPLFQATATSPPTSTMEPSTPTVEPSATAIPASPTKVNLMAITISTTILPAATKATIPLLIPTKSIWTTTTVFMALTSISVLMK